MDNWAHINTLSRIFSRQKCKTFSSPCFRCRQSSFERRSFCSHFFPRWKAAHSCRDWLNHCTIFLCTFKNSCVAFALFYESWSIWLGFAAFGQIWADSASQHTSSSVLSVKDTYNVFVLLDVTHPKYLYIYIYIFNN